MQPQDLYDVAVIGAGVVGAGIARELSKYELKTLLIEKEHDVGCGTSKANSALICTGFDAKPGTLEEKLVRENSRLFREDVAPALDIPFAEIGALLIARTDEEYAQVPKILELAKKNEVLDARAVDAGEMYRLEPHLAPGMKGAVLVPKESIACPFTAPLAYVTQAVVNGTKLMLGTEVTGMSRDAAPGAIAIETSRGTVHARYAVNAAGLFADKIDAMMGREDFRINPRKGEFFVYDKSALQKVSHILLQVPTPHTKGILISPTIFGNVILGPTADDHQDVYDTSTSREGLARIERMGRLLMPSLVDDGEITTTYAGNRSATQFSDYQIRFHGDRSYVTVGGIRSTGLSAALGIGRYVVDGLKDLGLVISAKKEFKLVRMPYLGEFEGRPEPGQMVCFCEKVSRREIEESLRSVVPATSLGGVKRRTRASMGRCQGFNCMPRIMQLVAAARGMSVKEYYEGGARTAQGQ